jgi:hypothetical protein
MLLQDARIPLGPWLPDLPFYENPGLVEAKNCIPVDKYYAEYLPLSTSGDALTALATHLYTPGLPPLCI